MRLPRPNPSRSLFAGAALSLLALSVTPVPVRAAGETTAAVTAISAAPDVVVSPEKGARFPTLQSAIDAAPENGAEPFVILLKPGRYRFEQTLIPASKRKIRLVGEDRDNTVVSYHLNVRETVIERHLNGFEGTTLIVLSDDFQAENLTVENSSGDHGQALALRIDGDRAVLRNCRLLGWQDTLMVNNGRAYFDQCHIEGRVDFIYGSATAVFDRCVIHSKNGGYVTAPNTPVERPWGFVFLDCKLTGSSEPWDTLAARKTGPQTYLGRPWRPWGSATFIRCELGDHIRPEGWNNWRNPKNEETARFAEYKSTGPGANPMARTRWSRQLSDAEAAACTPALLLEGNDHWDGWKRR